MKTRLILLGLVGGLAMTYTAPSAVAKDRAAEEWTSLGERKVDRKAEKDTIEVGSEDGRFRRIKLLVRDGDIELYRARVIFGNGDEELFEINAKVQEGSSVGPFDLKGRDRVIKRVLLTYKTSPHEEHRALVVLLGQH